MLLLFAAAATIAQIHSTNERSGGGAGGSKLIANMENIGAERNNQLVRYLGRGRFGELVNESVAQLMRRYILNRRTMR